jgi:hypothetical protein
MVFILLKSEKIILKGQKTKIYKQIKIEIYYYYIDNLNIYLISIYHFKKWKIVIR